MPWRRDDTTSTVAQASQSNWLFTEHATQFDCSSMHDALFSEIRIEAQLLYVPALKQRCILEADLACLLVSLSVT